MRTFLTAALSAILVVGATVAVVVVVITISHRPTSIFQLGAGDCFDLPDFGDDESRPTAALDNVDRVGCKKEHTAEVVLTGQLNPDQDREYPSDEELFDEIFQHCRPLRAAAEELGYGVLPVAPNESAWEPRGGPYLCLAIPFGGTPTPGSITDQLVTETV